MWSPDALPLSREPIPQGSAPKGDGRIALAQSHGAMWARGSCSARFAAGPAGANIAADRTPQGRTDRTHRTDREPELSYHRALPGTKSAVTGAFLATIF